MARTVIGTVIVIVIGVCPCKLVKNRMALYDPNSPLPIHRHCWCQPIILYHLCGWVPGSKIIKANLLNTTLLRHL